MFSAVIILPIFVIYAQIIDFFIKTKYNNLYL